MKTPRVLRLIAFKVRWLRWWLSPTIPIELYTGVARVDKQSRDIVWDRREKERLDREPKWSEE